MNINRGTTLTEKEIREQIEKLSPFHHNIQLPYGITTHIPSLSFRDVEKNRVGNFVDKAFPYLLNEYGGSLKGKRVLDLACNCGGFSFEAAKNGADYVLGIDIVDRYIEQANFIKKALKTDNVEFLKNNIEDLDISKIGEFDITFCFGIFYHLENPISTMEKIGLITKELIFVDTTIIRTPFTKKPIWLMNMPPVCEGVSSYDASSGLWRNKDKIIEFQPNMLSALELMKYFGFTKIINIKPKFMGFRRGYITKSRATFLAMRT